MVKESSSMQLVPYCSGSKLLSAINSASKCSRPPLKKPDVLETRFKLNCISKLLIHTYQPQTLVDCFVINIRIWVVLFRFILSFPPRNSPISAHVCMILPSCLLPPQSLITWSKPTSPSCLWKLSSGLDPRVKDSLCVWPGVKHVGLFWLLTFH